MAKILLKCRPTGRKCLRRALKGPSEEDETGLSGGNSWRMMMMMRRRRRRRRRIDVWETKTKLSLLRAGGILHILA
jgi:hypothetical protein